MMFLLKTAGMPVPSSSSSAIYVLSMEDCQKTGHTKLVQVYTSMYLFVKVCNVFNNFLPDDLFRELVFFNTFDELLLPIKGAMEDAGVIKLYKPSPTPCLYVAPAENMVGSVKKGTWGSDDTGPKVALKQRISLK